MSSIQHLEGIIPALITPYTEQGQINEPVTRQFVRHLMEQGVAAFYLSGTTGEGFLQTIPERLRLLEVVVDEVKGRVPVIAQVGAMDTATSVELAASSKRLGADALSSVAPFYYKHHLNEVKQHYLDIVEAGELPLIIYHVPGMTGVNASASFYRDLAQVDNVVGVKFTSKDTFELQQLIAECGEDFLVFNGPDECCLAGLAIGCNGAIGSTYNFMPGIFIKLFNELRQGNLAGARQAQGEANRIIAELLKYDFLAFSREILRLQGFEVGAPRKPIQQLSDEQRREIRRFAEREPLLGIAAR